MHFCCGSLSRALDFPTMAKVHQDSELPVVFFDGDCSLCNSAIQFVIARDPFSRFRFASLQSELGQRWSTRASVSVDGPDATMLLLEGGRLFQKSDAALRVARRLGKSVVSRAGWACWGRMGLLVPRFVRDAVYTWVARNRHKLGFASDTCWVPTDDLKRRLVE